MDFRSQYFKPPEEAPDRGKRIGRRTIEKLSQIVGEGGAVAVAPPPPPSEEPPPPPRDEKIDDEKVDEKVEERVDEPLDPTPPPPPPRELAEPPPPPPSSDPVASQKVEVEAEPTASEEEIIRAMIGGGSGLLHTYTLSSDAVAASGLSHQLKPLSLVALEVELTIPGVGLAILLGGSFRPVRYELGISDATPRGALIDSLLVVGYNIA